MVNVKLGDKTYQGVNTVRLDTTDGKKMDFVPFEETFAAGKAEGYTQGKKDGIAEGYANGKEDGIQSEYDRFWDSFQNNGEPMSYQRVFASRVWNDLTFHPKHNIIASGTYGCADIFRVCDVTNIAQRLEEQGVILDVSRCTYFEHSFRETASERWPAMDLRSATTVAYAFHNIQAHTIDKLIVNENLPWNNTFNAANKLANITFEGTIGQDINFQWCPLSVASMKSIIVHLKNYSGTANAAKYKVTFTDACWAALAADGTTAPDGNAWRDYVEITLGWLT